MLPSMHKHNMAMMIHRFGVTFLMYNPSKTLLRRKVRNVFVVFQAGGNDPQFTLTLRTQNISAVH